MQVTKTIVAEVVLIIDEFKQAICDYNGWQYTITEKAKGISWNTLKVGDIVTLEVFSQVLVVKEVLNVNP